MENKDKPAFPGLTKEGYQQGLTKYEYYLAHAPETIPKWFRHEPKKEPAKQLHWQDIPPDDPYYPFREELHQWHVDQSYDLPPNLQWYSQAIEKYQDDMAEWHRVDQLERYFQWRQFYATTMASL